MASDTTWIVTVSSERPLKDVAADLRAEGLEDTHVLDAIGSITGHGAENLGKRLRSVKGVAAVEKETAVDIGPPDSTVS